MGGSEAGRPEPQHEHGAGQQVPAVVSSDCLSFVRDNMYLLAHVESEAGLGGAGGEVVIPRLLSHHNQPEVDLNTER